MFGRVVGVACAHYVLGNRAKATSLAALAGGGKVIVAGGSLDGKIDGSVVSKVISGAVFAAQHATSPHHASHPMRVVLDLDEKSSVLGAEYFLARRFAAYPSLPALHDAETASDFFVEVQSESELRGSVDAVVALVCVFTLWTSPPCSLALWFSVTGALPSSLFALVGDRCLSVLRLASIDGSESESESQDSAFDERRYSEHPVPERSGSAREELRGNLQHKPTETENKMKDTNK